MHPYINIIVLIVCKNTVYILIIPSHHSYQLPIDRVLNRSEPDFDLSYFMVHFQLVNQLDHLHFPVQTGIFGAEIYPNIIIFLFLFILSYLLYILFQLITIFDMNIFITLVQLHHILEVLLTKLFFNFHLHNLFLNLVDHLILFTEHPIL